MNIIDLYIDKNANNNNSKNNSKKQLLNYLFVSLLIFIIFFTPKLTLAESNNNNDNIIKSDNIDSFINTLNQSYQRYMELHQEYSYLNNTLDKIDIEYFKTQDQRELNTFYLKNDKIYSNSIYLEILDEIQKKHYEKLYLVCNNKSIKIKTSSITCQNVSNLLKTIEKKYNLEISQEDLLLLYSHQNHINSNIIKQIDFLSMILNTIKENNYKNSNFNFKNTIYTNNSLYSITDNSEYPYKSLELSSLSLTKYKELENFVLIKDKSTIIETLEKTNVIYTESELINNQNNLDQNSKLLSKLTLNNYNTKYLKNKIYTLDMLKTPSINQIEEINTSKIIQEYNSYMRNLYQKNKNQIFSKIEEIYRLKVNQDTSLLEKNNKSILKIDFRFNKNQISNQSYYFYLTNLNNTYEEIEKNNINKNQAISFNIDIQYNQKYYLIVSKEKLTEISSIDSNSNYKIENKESIEISSIIFIKNLFDNSLKIENNDNNFIEETIKQTNLKILNKFKENWDKVLSITIISLLLLYIIYSSYNVFYKKQKFNLIYKTHSKKETKQEIENKGIQNKDIKENSNKNKKSDKHIILQFINKFKNIIKLNSTINKLKNNKTKKKQKDNKIENKENKNDYNNENHNDYNNHHLIVNKKDKINNKTEDDINELMRLNSNDLEEFRNSMLDVAKKIDNIKFNSSNIDKITKIINSQIEKIEKTQLNSKSKISHKITKEIQDLENKITPHIDTDNSENQLYKKDDFRRFFK